MLSKNNKNKTKSEQISKPEKISKPDRASKLGAGANKMRALRRVSKLLKGKGFKKSKSFIPLYHEIKKGTNSLGVGFQVEKGGFGIAADLTLNGQYIGRADELFTDEIISDNFWKFTTYEELVEQLDEITSLILGNYEDILNGRLDLNKRREERDKAQEEFFLSLSSEDREKMEKIVADKMNQWNKRRAGEALPLWKEVWEMFGFIPSFGE